MIDIIKYDGSVPKRILERAERTGADVAASVHDIVETVRAEGDAALLRYTKMFDGIELRSVAVGRDKLIAAAERISPELLASMRRSAENIRAFHEKQIEKTWLDMEKGKALGQLIRPIDSVGVYVPGGRAPLSSTVLMNLIPAKVAGVPRVVLVSPPGKDGRLNDTILAAALLGGADEVYAVGGAHAIAALAYGTETIAPVCKITGPGNKYVQAAKKEVFGVVGIDMIAGPSEIMIIADETAKADWLAADMLSQAEHDPAAASILVTTSEKLAEEVVDLLPEKLAALPTRPAAEASVKNYGTVVVAKDVYQAVELANKIAPEHLELCVSDPFGLLRSVRNAGAVFLGHSAPEPLGDYYAGPNHTLPTYGTAKFSSPLGVYDFIKRSSIIYYGSEELNLAGPDIIRFAESEGLYGHAAAVRERLDS